MITFDAASVSYADGEQALDALSLDVKAGEVVALVGPSGSGKTTALRAINGLVPLSNGKIVVLNKPQSPNTLTEMRRKIGYVIQDAGLLPHWTVGQNIQTVPLLLKWPKTRRTERAKALLSEVKLGEELWSRYPEELSGGQRQRVGLARALAGEPKLLLMDEPFGALDPITRQHMRQLVRNLLASRPITTVIVTHDLTDALDLADRIALLKAGKLVQVGDPQQLVTAPTNDWVRNFISAGLPQRPTLETTT